MRDLPQYLDTPAGIVTPSGLRFRTTEALLEAWAGSVFTREPLGALVRRAEVWLRAPATVALVALPFLLLAFPPWVAGLAAVGLYVVDTLAFPAAPSRRLGAALAVLERPVVQGLLYVVVLSALGMAGNGGAVVVGLAGFVGFRLGAVQALLRPVLGPLLRRLYPLPVPDQVLRAHVVRAALRHGIRLPELERLERSAQAAVWGRKARG
jgi:hypothetical protein